MNPEQRLLEVHKYLPVKLFIILIFALIGMFIPQWLRIAERNRTFVNLHPVPGRRDLYYFFLSFIIFLFLCLGFFMDMFYYNIVILQVFFVNGLIFLFCICLAQIDVHRHK